MTLKHKTISDRDLKNIQIFNKFTPYFIRFFIKKYIIANNNM